MTQETKLLQAAKDGNAAAFEEIVIKYQSLVCAITFSGTGRVDISEELAQETFLSAWKNLRQLTDPGGFRPWLCTIARNMLNSYYRKKKPLPLDPADIADRSAPTPSDHLITQEEHVMLEQALMQIPAKYREPLVMYYRQEQSTKEVAIGLGLNESTVRTRLHRARQMLREEIAARLEQTLEKTAPDKTFTKTVMAGIGAGLAAGAAGTATATAAVAGPAGAGAGTTTGIAAVMSTVTAKVITAVAIGAIVVGSVFVYQHLSQPAQLPAQSDEIAVVQKEQEPIITFEDVKPALPEIQNVEANPIEAPAVPLKAVATITDAEDTAETEAASISQTTEIPESSEYVFEPNGVLSGLITDVETGEPVTDAEVTLRPGRLYRAKTDENGFYSFDIIDKNGDYSIGVYSKEYVGLTDYDVHPRVHLKKNTQSAKHFRLPKACMIDLYVVDEEGNPVKGSRVWVTSLASEHGREVGKSYASQRTDKDGYILLGGLAPSDKPYVITSTHYVKGEKVWNERYKQKIREQILDFAPGHIKVTLQDPDIIEYGEIVLQKGTQVQGIAKYTDGTPAKECKIVPYPDWWHSTTVPPGYKIDPNGLFTLSHIAPGSYRIQASIPSGDHSSMGRTLFTAQLPSEEDKLLEVTIPKKPTNDGSSKRDKIVEAKLNGIITDALTGKPIPTFRLRYQRISGNRYTDDGKWVQFNNNKGDFTLNVTGNDHAVCKVQAIAEGYASQWSEEINTKDNRAVLIKLAPGSSITGTVVDEKGKPVGNAKILPYSLAGAARNHQEPIFVSEEGAVTTDENGLFTLENITPGSETLKISHPNYTYKLVTNIEVKQALQSDLGKIVLGKGGIVEGVFYDNQGKPQPGVTLFAQNHYGFSSSEVQHGSVITDPNGFFRFENLPTELCYIVRPRSYQHTGVVSRAVVPTNNKITRLDFGGGPVVRGRLVINGQPLKNTRLTLSLGQSSVSGLYRSHADTDDNGRFEIPAGMPGTYTLTYNQKSKTFTSNHIKVMDVAVGTKGIDLGILPSQKRILQVNIQASDEQRELMQYFYVVEGDPIEGSRVFWQEDIKQSKGPYSVNLPGPGLYYGVIQCSKGDWKRYQYPVLINDGEDYIEITLPFEQGDVALTGTLPEQINHVWFTNQDQSVAGILYANKKDNSNFRVEGLFPGTYYLSPKSANYRDGIEVNVPNTTEYTLNLDLAALQEKLKERVSVHVFDKQGLPVENANVWIQGDNMSFLPASRDNCSSDFYLPDGEHIIHAEKDGIKTTKSYRLKVDKNNTASGESYETYIQIK